MKGKVHFNLTGLFIELLTNAQRLLLALQKKILHLLVPWMNNIEKKVPGNKDEDCGATKSFYNHTCMLSASDETGASVENSDLLHDTRVLKRYLLLCPIPSSCLSPPPEWCLSLPESTNWHWNAIQNTWPDTEI